MTLNDKLEQVRYVLEEHNKIIGDEKSSGFIDIENFLSRIKLIGGTSEERLKRFSHEDIANCLPTITLPSLDPESPLKKVKQTILAKEIASIFRGNSNKSDNNNKPVTSKKCERMTLEELVGAYDPSDLTSPVASRLSEISKNQNFIVFSMGREVDVKTTHDLLKELTQGYDGRDSIIVEGEVKKVYPVGYLPDNYADENPLYPGRPLRPDGTCDQTNRSWEGIDQKLRQLVRIAIDNGYRVTRESSHNMLDLLMSDKPLEEFKKRYSDFVLVYNELEEQQKLPRLKVVLSSFDSKNKSEGPFKDGKQVVWGYGPDKKSYKSYTGPR